MDQQTVERLVSRIERLERSNRRLRMAGLFGLMLMSAVMLLGWQSMENELRAQAFVTENGYGFLSQGSSGNPWLNLTAQRGPNSDIILAAYETSELSLSFYQDRDNTPRLRTGVAPDGSPFVLLAREDGDVLASFRIFDNGTPALWLTSPNGPANMLIQGFADGEMTVGVYTDVSKPPRVAMGVLPDGTPFINMRDANGNVTWSAGNESSAPRSEPTRTTLPMPPTLR